MMVLQCYSATIFHLKKDAVSTLPPESFRPWLVLTVFFIYLEVLFLQEKESLSKIRKRNPQSICLESHFFLPSILTHEVIIHGDNSICKKYTEDTKLAFYSCKIKYT